MTKLTNYLAVKSPLYRPRDAQGTDDCRTSQK